MTAKALLLLALIAITLSVDYCETNKPSTSIFMTNKEVRKIDLSSYVRGYDLSIEVDDASIAKVYSSFQVTSKHPMNLGDYNDLKSVDTKSFANLPGLGHGAFLAQKENDKQIAIWVGQFLGYNNLPNFGDFKKLTLPSTLSANCFDLRIVNDKGDSVLSCQTIPKTQTDNQWDLFCYIGLSDTELNLGANCNLISSLATSLSRKNRILSINKNNFLLSANTDLTDSKESISYISVYYINSKNQLVFNNIIDSSSIDISRLEISDFVISNDNTIIVADSAQSRLIFFEYTASNDVIVKNVKIVQSRPLALAYSSSRNTLLVATKDFITEHKTSDPDTILIKYQVDQSDSLISKLEVSNSFLAFSTQNKNLYIYQRSQTKINYLLQKIELADSKFILSQNGNYLFTFNTQTSQAVSVSNPYIQLSKIAKDQILHLKAKSTTSVCTIQLNIGYVEDTDTIVAKDILQAKSFKVDPLTGLNIKLDNYYGGINLKYNLPQANDQKDFDFSIEQISQYDLTPSFGKTQTSTILHINSNSFYFIGINSIQEGKAYVDICTYSNNKIGCVKSTEIKLISNTKKQILAISSKIRSNGQSIVMWSYKSTGIVQWIYIERNSVGFHMHGYPYNYASLHIAEDYFIFVSKTGRHVSVLFENSPYYFDIQDSIFTPEQLTTLEKWYPREVYIDRYDQSIIFIKMPTTIAQFSILPNHKVTFVGIVKTFSNFILDQNWSIIDGYQNFIIANGGTITEEYYNPTSSEYITLQSIDYPTPKTPIKFDLISNLIVVVSNPANNGDKTVKFMKQNKGSMDLQYAEVNVKGDPTLSGNWLLVNGDTFSIYYVSNDPILSVTSNLPQDVFKEDLQFSIQIKSKTKSQTSKAEVQAVNFPINIKDIPNTQNVVKAPVIADNLYITIPVQKYFNGPIVDYFLQCPFCGGKRVHLYPPLRQFKRITEQGALDFVSTGNRIATIFDNVLILMNNDAEIITHSPIIQQVSCTNLEYNADIGLLVFCTSETGQQILKYDVNKDHFIFDDLYVLHGQTAIRNFDEMFATTMGDKQFLYILDNDETIDSNNKKSTVKLFDISTTEFTFVGEWDSKLFGTTDLYPINDFEIYEDVVFVTLGNYGFGYAIINADGTLTSANNIGLGAIPDIKDILLDDSYFKQIDVLSYDQKTKVLKLFITSTTSLNMVITFNNNNNVLTFQALTESYFRYGNLRLLNWHEVTNTNVYLSFYNEDLEEATIVSYPRKENAHNQFNVGVPVRVSKNMVKYHQAFISNNQLITSHLNDVPETNEIITYSIVDHFSLYLNYDVAGDFTQITILAMNKYKDANHIQKIKFDTAPGPDPIPDPEPDGLKWYIVVIVASVVLIIVGTAYGLFRYMKKKRAQKSVSLLTEHEQNQDDEKKKDIGEQQEVKEANETFRTSINDD